MASQLIFNTLVSGSLLALLASGFFLVFHVNKVFHLAHAAAYVAGAYALLYFLGYFGMAASILLACIFLLILAFLMEVLVYRPLAKRKAGQIISLISSTGMYLFLINLIALLFGNESRMADPGLGKGVEYLDIIILPIQAIQLIASLCILTSLLLLSRTRIFLKLRAIMSRQEIASVMGIDVNAYRLLAICMGTVIAGIVGILFLLDTGVNPHAGMAITLSAAVAVILAGSNSITGTIVASLLVASFQTITEWFLSAQWKDGVTFLLLIAVILWRTEGFVSYNLRIEET